MRFSSLACVTRVLGIIFVASLLSGLLSSRATAAPPEAPASAETTPVPALRESPPPATAQPSPEELRLREEWLKEIRKVPVPKQGCFKATHPSTEWQEVPCTAAPPYPMPPRRGSRPLVVGNSNDVSPQVPSGFISTAIGSFDSVTGVTSESGPIGNSGPPVADAYTLQINTNFFSSTACAGSPNPACKGWEQFVFWNDGSSGSIFIQYWLIKYNATCPAGVGWNQFSFNGGTEIYCYKNNNTGAAPVPNQPIANLGQLSLTGTVSASGDSIILSTGSNAYSVPGDNAVNAAAGWQIAEFNVFGPGGNSAGGSQASFNSGSTIVPRTRVIYGGTAPPICVAQGFTGETNNLSFGPTAPVASPPGPALLFTESSAGGAPSNCAAATAVGDTHLATFNGLFYDFQATGDFILAQSDPGFVVQTRQVSGAPTWPNASVNSAVAMQMGKHKLALCMAAKGETTARLVIDGKATSLGDGKSLDLAGGVGVLRRGNMYVFTDQEGNSVRAIANTNTGIANNWIDVDVGLGRWPAKVSGLLANPNGNANALEARDGTVLTMPVSFEELYGRFGNSWRVPASQSLLSVCGDKKIERSIPTKTFYANNLNRDKYAVARTICTEAGVKDEALLDACTLDVTVLGNKKAARVFLNKPVPVVVMPPPALKPLHKDLSH
jgi:hypothetical protein